jgi:hypothetical protein
MSRNHEELLKHGPHGNYTRGGQRMEKKGNDTDHLFFQSNIKCGKYNPLCFVLW